MLTPTVTAAGGLPTGTVEFFDGAASLGQAALMGGEAGLTVSNLPVGARSPTAAYAGDANFAASTSTALSQTVNKGESSLALAPLPGQINPGGAATLLASATALSPSVATPTGTLTFRPEGASDIGSAALNSGGVARLITTALPFGVKGFSAVYGGSAGFNGAASLPITVAVDFRLGPARRLNFVTAGVQTNPAAALGTGGAALAVWESAVVRQPNAVRARRILADVALAGEFGVSGPASGVGAPKVAGLSNGDYVVVWHFDGASGREIRMRRFGPAGAPLDLARQVNAVAAGIRRSRSLRG